MRLLPTSLRGRLVASAVLFIVLALGGTALAIEVSLHRFVRGQIDQRLDTEAASLASALAAGPDGELTLNHPFDGPPFDDPHSGWFWLVRAGPDSWGSRGLADPQGFRLPVPAVADPVTPHPRPPVDGTGPDGQPVRLRVVSMTIGSHAVTIAAAAPRHAERGPLRDALGPVIVALLLLGCGLVGATLVQVQLGLQPLDRLRASLAAVRDGRAERLPADQPAEVQPLVGEMNQLLAQHTANLERARRHVANLAHALKTPLATLALGLEAPGRDPDRSLRGLTVAMDRRIRHHLARARAAALGTAARASLPLAARVADHVAAFGKIYADRAINAAVDVPAEASVACDGQDLDEMVGNLLDNAFKWARSAIRIEARAMGRSWRLSIADDGPGVAPAELDAVLQPGRRLDEGTPGDGFGLPIARELAELYGGGLTLARSEEGGLAAALDLPAAQPATERAA